MMSRRGKHHGRHPQEQRRLIESSQWVSHAANPFHVALSVVFVCASRNLNLTAFSMKRCALASKHSPP
jgi:hypothetical protein